MSTDLSFENYNERAFYEITAERNQERALTVKPASNFVNVGNGWQAQEYQGFAIISMLNENPGNDALIVRLNLIQEELRYNLSPITSFYHLPAESFHQTVANTLSADRFKEHILNPGLEDSYPGMVSNAFENIPPSRGTSPIRMKMVGLSIFGTAIGILGVFDKEADYYRILDFRAAFYNNKQLTALDVKMTRPFIGHITMAYIEHSLNKNQKGYLAGVINELNQTLFTENNYFNISTTGLRRYHHLAEFTRKDHYPFYKL